MKIVIIIGKEQYSKYENSAKEWYSKYENESMIITKTCRWLQRCSSVSGTQGVPLDIKRYEARLKEFSIFCTFVQV